MVVLIYTYTAVVAKLISAISKIGSSNSNCKVSARDVYNFDSETLLFT